MSTRGHLGCGASGHGTRSGDGYQDHEENANRGHGHTIGREWRGGGLKPVALPPLRLLNEGCAEFEQFVGAFLEHSQDRLAVGDLSRLERD